MSCCAPGAAYYDRAAEATRGEELKLASRSLGGPLYQIDLAVPDVRCGACIQTIERAVGELKGVSNARVNLSTKRLTAQWWDDGTPPPIVETLAGLGYAAHLLDPAAEQKDETLRELVRALAVAGFAASNIMLLSVSVWSGAEAATRDLFHWLSAAIALPTLAYSGRVFFRSAWGALRHGRTNMDVPISIGVLLAFGLSLYETARHGQHVYFDASVSLLFFLLIGRTLDHMMRNRARTAVAGLARLAARGALVLREGGPQYVPVEEIEPGTTILLAAGERVPVDARVVSGESELDCALVSGESAPRAVSAGSTLQAGTLNLTAPLTLVATAAAKDSFLAEMMRLMEAAESGRSAYRRIADRAARLYAPFVHLTAFLTFIGWMVVSGDPHRAITVAIAVLIITCPCALGLAVPMVQVVAAARLFENGVMVKDGTALERLAEIDSVVFDKTGTLTLGEPRLKDAGQIDERTLDFTAALASHSRHPYSRALAAAGHPAHPLPAAAVKELPGLGLAYSDETGSYRLGRPAWALDPARPQAAEAEGANVVLSRDGCCLAAFRFEDRLRADAGVAADAFARLGFDTQILSGDSAATVRELAETLHLRAAAELTPADKVGHIATMQRAGRKVLMIGDGLNDVPALAAAHVSMAPASGADVGRQAADLVFLHESLTAAPLAFAIARRAGTLIRENIVFSVGYNLVAVPIAILGHATPLVAAVAMSLSSVIVIANAMRLRGPRAAKQVERNRSGRSRVIPAGARA